MIRAPAYAKINLALVVGPVRRDGMHEVVTVLQAVDLHDDLELRPSSALAVDGFEDDTLVQRALVELAAAIGISPRWQVRVVKRIPVAAGLGGGSSDAATALRLANSVLERPLAADDLLAIAAQVGADVPFFLSGGCQLGTGTGTDLTPLELDADFHVLLVLPSEVAKMSTADVYERFDARGGDAGFDDRRTVLLDALNRGDLRSALRSLPRNDLAQSPLAARLEELGAFRADVSGAGPAVYGLFERRADGARAAESLADEGRCWLCRPVARW